MNKITQLAVKGTVDPMQEVMDHLFGKEYEIYISDEILEIMKKTHSYNMTPNGNEAVYTFNKRGRATHIYYSFTVVSSRENENRVSKLEYTTEIGLTEKHHEVDNAPRKKVYITLQEEN